MSFRGRGFAARERRERAEFEGESSRPAPSERAILTARGGTGKPRLPPEFALTLRPELTSPHGGVIPSEARDLRGASVPPAYTPGGAEAPHGHEYRCLHAAPPLGGVRRHSTGSLRWKPTMWLIQ